MAANVFKSDPIAFRYAILYEFLQGKPIFETFRNLCERLGKMDYMEFEYWFMKCSREEFDVNYERKLDLKFRTICDLPVHIFNEIGSYLNSDDRYNLRNVSKNIRKIVDYWKPNVDDLWFNGKMTNYERRKCADLLKNPKLELESLEVSLTENRSAELIASVLKQSKHQIRVENFIMRPIIPEIGSIISKLDPEAVKMVQIRINDESIDKMSEILQLEQIKELDSFIISTDLPLSKFPLQSFYDCSVFHIDFFEATKLKPLVSFIKILLKTNKNLKKCRFSFDIYRRREKFFRKMFSKLGTSVSGRMETRRIPITGTNDFYKLEYSDFEIKITRED